MALSAFSILNIAKKCHYQNVRFISSLIYQNSDGVEKKNNIFVKKFTQLNESYVKFIGLDELRGFQDRVITTQIKLEKAQEKRRQIGNLLNEVRKRANDLLEQLHKVDRSNDRKRYVDLTVKETEEFRKGQELAKQFEELDKAECEIFTALCSAVRDSHEKERAQAEHTKYIGIILSIVGAFFGAILSMTINMFRTWDPAGGIEKDMTLVRMQMKSLDKKLSALHALGTFTKNDISSTFELNKYQIILGLAILLVVKTLYFG